MRRHLWRLLRIRNVWYLLQPVASCFCCCCCSPIALGAIKTPPPGRQHAMNAHKHLTRNQQGARAVAAGEMPEDGGEGDANWGQLSVATITSVAAAKHMIALSCITLFSLSLDLSRFTHFSLLFCSAGPGHGHSFRLSALAGVAVGWPL